MVKKKFFEERTVAQIKKLEKIVIEPDQTVKDIAKVIEDTASGQYVLVTCQIIPGDQTVNKFKKHGPDVKLKRFASEEDMIASALTPLDLRAQAFGSITSPFYSCYSIKPFGVDSRTNRISLETCIEGARIFAYVENTPSTSIDIMADYSAKVSRREGTTFVVSVPSRTKGEDKHEFTLYCVPTERANKRFSLWPKLRSTHNCKSKEFGRIRYNYEDQKEDSKVFIYCPHEVAAYLKICSDRSKAKNRTPLEMSPFALPSEKTVEFYVKAINNVLKIDEDGKLRKLNRADIEILLWAMTINHRDDKPWYASGRIRKLQDYNWQIPKA